MNSLDLFGNPQTADTVGDNQTYSRPGFHLPPDHIDDTVEEDQRVAPNLTMLGIIAIATCAMLAAQCFRLQVTQGGAFQTKAEGNSVRLLTIPADRGLIVDSSGTVLAQNSRQLALAIDPQSIPAKRTDRLAVYNQLKKDAGISQEIINQIEETVNPKDPKALKRPEIFPIKTNLSKDDSLLYKEKFAQTKGVLIQEVPIRNYTQFASMGQLLGYVGSPSDKDLEQGATRDELLGKTGLEAFYNDQLTGTPGKQKAEVNALGEVVQKLSKGTEGEPKAGETLKLGLDLRLQGIVAGALKNELDRRTKKFGPFKDLGASAVVIDPSTGVVKAMVSLPDYDGTLFANGISGADYKKLLDNPANPLLNRAIQGQYPSGSVIKPLIAGAALQAGVVNDKFQVVTPDALVVSGFRFPDWKVHGLTNIRKAIAESNDIFFYALGGGWKEKGITGLGIDSLNDWLSRFGLGKPTGIDLPGEDGGLLAGPAWKEKNVGEQWYIGDTYHASIGQGYTLTTPLQMAVATAGIANGGTVWKPSLAESWIDASTNKETPLPRQVITKDFISPQNIQIVKEGMRQTVESGSARPLNTLKVTSAGKTGTAEFGTKNQTHAWYTGFAPYDKPQLAFAIMIEGGGESFYSSVPVAEEILRGYFNEPLAPGQQLSSNTDVPTEFTGEH